MSNISCNCSVEVDEYPDIYSIKLRKARKPHICCECGCNIKIGKTYEYTTMLTEGEWLEFKTCAPCISIRKRYCPDGWYFGFLNEHISDCLGMNYITGETYWEDE